jgi:chromosomal replication initiator protein
MDNKTLWNTVLNELELEVSKATFSTWFKATYIIKIEEGIVHLSVPNAFVKDWLINKYHRNILRSLRNLNEHVRSMEYIINKDESRREEQSFKPVMSATSELPLNDYYINKDDNLNPRYTFESFIVGPFNELAHAAAQAIIKSPGKVYNPFFIFGNTGHGKTHLIQAVGNHIKKNNPGKKIYYVTSEKFAQDYVNSLQGNKTAAFKEKYRKYDVLIMDDVQFISGKEKIQEELFHLFNVMHETNKQIIFSCDKHPNVLTNLEDRLKSRFSSGMIVDLPYPDLESRTAILKAKARASNFILSDELTTYLASSVEGNIRELEGILNSIVCQSQLKGDELTIAEIKNLIKNSAKPKKNISVKDIIKVIADFYKIEENNIYDKTRRKEVVRPRQIAMYILREDCNVSYPSIGQKLGGRDHTTVIHSCEKIKSELKVDPILLHELNQIRSLI